MSDTQPSAAAAPRTDDLAPGGAATLPGGGLGGEALPGQGLSGTELPGGAARPHPLASPPAEESGPADDWRYLGLPLVLLLALGAYLLLTRDQAPLGPPPGDDPLVRILLVEGAAALPLQLEGDWRLYEAAGPQWTPQGEGLRLSGELELRGGRVVPAAGESLPLPGERCLLAPAERGQGAAPPFGLLTRRYRGTLRVQQLPDGRLRAVNAIELEDYLSGVIGHEMPLSWSDEALKVQAICARSYAVRELKPGRDYDMERDARSQVYKGVMAEDARARAMVEATRGQVIKHEGRVITAYFHSTCGGDTVPASWVFDWVKQDTPPLMGASECTCQASKYYRWEKEGVDLSQLRGIKVRFPLQKLEIEHWPRGGYVKRVVLTGKEGQTQAIQGYRARSRFGLRAPCFEGALRPDGKTADFKGKGWGHGVGMCQFGAEGFAKQGWSAEEILRHFYPQTSVEQL